MHRINLIRTSTSGTGTFGILNLGSYSLRTGELPERDNRPGKSCIPSGCYSVDLKYSEHFHRDLYHVLNVPGRQDIEIHSGNWCGDIELGYRSDVRGCILLGLGVGDILTPEGNHQIGISSSKAALEEFMKLMTDEPFELEIVWNLQKPS